ncbi:MAG: site-specific integrase [Ktedonobacterales bacterium]|nr:site-specific integrase [Ktedonobacterales bacterium]
MKSKNVKRRGNQEGTITQRKDGRWEARMSLPDGKRKSYYGDTRDEVQKKMRQGQRDVDAGLPIVGEKQTVEHFLLFWLENKQHQVKATSFVRYSVQVRKHAIPGLGRVVLSKLTAQQLQSFYSRKVTEGLSPTTVKHLHVILHSALDDAVRLGLIPRNVADMARPPRIVHHEMQSMDDMQVARFIDAAQRDSANGALFILAITTGMRIGELTGLRWKDIDLDKGTVQVQQTLVSMAGKLLFTEPKTRKARRSIRLMKIAIYALRKQRIWHLEQAMQFGPEWNKHDLVFANSSGNPLDPTALRTRFFAFLKEESLPRIRFHDLRHTAATLMLKRGVNVKVVSEMLGHANISITLGVYGHLLPDMQQAAIDIMDSFTEEL